MDMGMVLSVAQTLFAALQCTELREFCSSFGYKSELERLERTVDTVKAVLKDAESMEVQEELGSQFQLYVDQLKDAVYDADDLLDKFVTLARRKKLIKGGKISEKVRLLISSFNPLTTARTMSRGVKEIRKKLDNIANDHTKFGFKLESKPILKRREETCSYVYVQDIIGREDDVDKIMHKLLDPNVKQDVSCLTIVGIGGLGKTALTQVVYNHPRIKENFPLRLWTCVADQDIKGLDVEDTLRKILHSATREKHDHLSMDNLQIQLQKELAGKKYFLVLDDVWNEDRYQWLKLMEFLRDGVKGSWVLVTTRSSITATIVGGEMHELKGLSNDDSWLLFEKTAFDEDREQTTRLELDQIGREIVKQCANVPLAIKVVGAALYRQDKKRWQSCQELGLGRIEAAANSIKPILKLSYLNLDPQLRICFSYCALFPKDSDIDKAKLIYLWIAQGYVVVPSDKGQTVEDVGEEYFLILLRRCFFQDACKDEHGEIISCKMHDLMHDVAQEVAGKEIPQAGFMPSSSNDGIRHLYHLGWGQGTASLFTGGKIRTYLGVGHSQPESSMAFDDLLNNWKSLRALDLSCSGMTELPSTLGNLLHLRYLDLSRNFELEMLPNSITKLHNLQLLLLTKCKRLKEFPKNFGKLTNLRVLSMEGCKRLIELPKDLGRLTDLRVLSMEGCERLRELPKDLGRLTDLRVLSMDGSSDLKRGRSVTKLLHWKDFEIGQTAFSPLYGRRFPYLIDFSLSRPKPQSRPKPHFKSLDRCERFRELPEDLRNLTLSEKLFDLSVPMERCETFTELPKSLLQLTKLMVLDIRKGPEFPKSCLWKLHFPVLGEGTSSKEGGQLVDQTEEIKALNNLRGKLHIQINIPANANYGMGNGKKEGCLSQHLTEITTTFPERKLEEVCTRVCESDEALLEDLRPHPNLKVLELERYYGERMPNWARDDNLAMSLPNLVDISLLNCHKLEHLAVLGKLPKLKSLTINGWCPVAGDRPSSDLEYIENTTISGSCGSGVRAFGSEDSFFPSLEKLELCNLPKLKGWWSGDNNSDQEDGRLLPAFPRLSHLVIAWCPNLVSMPLCPTMEDLDIWECNVSLRIMKSIESGNSKLRRVSTDNMAHLRAALPIEAFQGLNRMRIGWDEKLEKLSEFEAVFRCCSSSLQQLYIYKCPLLKSVTGGLEHLTALESLELKCLPSLSEAGEGVEDDGTPWRCLHSLRSLNLISLPNMVKLPNGMRYLTTLEALKIRDLRELESLPEWMPELTFLKTLGIQGCSNTLKEQCRKGTGQDWPKIQHIPNFFIIRENYT